MTGAGNIKVVVRCRPLNARELARGATNLIRMEGNQTILTRGKDVKAYTFDKSYWSADRNDPHYADQETVYLDLGRDLLDHAFDGYNCCIFAYGQTGSGKSYSMMGYEDKGIIPRTCSELFDRVTAQAANTQFQVEVSYIEIYNEKVRDLLNPKNKGNLKVREHPSLGPYVEDLSRLVVHSYDDIDHLMNEGNKARTVAATNMNETSSRSHAVFTIFLTQKPVDADKDTPGKVARISLVDLAGSERANGTGATGARLKEGANINRSLTTLGKVIAALAKQSEHGDKRQSHGKKTKADAFIPYRDSTLTWLLKDSLGGNSKTAMIAAISPADYDETLSTLRYADQAKKIKNNAVVNEDANAKLIRELKEELQSLRDTLMVYAPEDVVEKITTATANGNHKGGTPPPVARKEITYKDAQGQVQRLTREEMVEQLQSSEKLLEDLNQTWEQKMQKTEAIHTEREKALEELGVMVEKDNMGVYTPRNVPHLVNLSEDPLMSECLVYQIKPGTTTVGRPDSQAEHVIRLSGTHIYDGHCSFVNENNIVTIYPGAPEAVMLVNGMRITEPKRLRSGFRIILGDYHIFRFNHPDEVRKERERTSSLVEQQQQQQLIRPDSPASSGEDAGVVDWTFARREAVLNHYQENDLSDLTDEDLEKLYDGIAKLRLSRGSHKRRSGFVDDDAASSTSSYRIGSMSTLPTTEEDVLSIDTTSADELLRQAREEMAMQLELQKKEYEEKIRNSSSTQELQRMLEEQRQKYESKIQRISVHLPPGSNALYSPLIIDDERSWVARRVLAHWRRVRYVAMAEAVLVNAITLKEANVIAKELKKNVVYQFVIADHDHTSASFWESRSVLERAKEEETSPVPLPTVAVLVVDKQHQVLYTWSLAKLQERLQQMRSLYDFNDQPPLLYQPHFNRQDPFYEASCPLYTRIGLARVPVRNLAFHVPIENEVDVVAEDGKTVAKLKVLVAPIARSRRRSSHSTQKNGGPQDPPLLHVGQQQVFEVGLLEISGIDEERQFTQVHAQFRISAAFGERRWFATEPVSDFGTSPIVFDHSQTLSLTVTPAMLEMVLHGHLTVEVYGKAQNEYLLDRIEQDIVREQMEAADCSHPLPEQRPLSSVSTHSSTTLTPVQQVLDHRRRSITPHRQDSGLLAEERHDVLARVEICELTTDGDYAPVVVEDGVLQLRQGVQRRIKLTLTHDSGRQLPWQAMHDVTFGHVRLEEHAQASDAALPIRLLEPAQVEYARDGTSTLTMQGAWDSSLHNSEYLNRATGDRVWMTLAWQVTVDKPLKSALRFSLDVPLMIQARTSSMLFRSLFSGKPARQVSALYAVYLKPPAQRRVADLWRLNTANKYVRGEEFLGGWRPRGVSLVQDYRVSVQRRHRAQQVAMTRHRLALDDLLRARRDQRLQQQQEQQQQQQSLQEPTQEPPQAAQEQPEQTGTDTGLVRATEKKTPEELLRRVVDLWTASPLGHKTLEDVMEPAEPVPTPVALVPHVQRMHPNATPTKEGYLWHPTSIAQQDEAWVKRYCVLRRPFLILYADASQTTELSVLNLTSIRFDYKKDLEDMLHRPNIFALYTTNNAYLLQASDKDDMVEWISAIDQFFPIDTLL